MKRGLRQTWQIFPDISLFGVGICTSMKRGLRLAAADKRYRERSPVGICTSMKRGLRLAAGEEHLRMYVKKMAREITRQQEEINRLRGLLCRVSESEKDEEDV